MLPTIVEKTTLENLNFFALTSYQILTGFRLHVVDREATNLDVLHSKLSDFFSNIHEDVTAKFILDSQFENAPFGLDRDDAIKSMGYINNNLYFFAFIKENKVSSLFKTLRSDSNSSIDSLAYKLKSMINLEALKDSFSLESLDEESLVQFLPRVNRDYIAKLPSSVDTGVELRGYVRLNKLGTNPISMGTIANIKDAIPTPYRLILNFKKMNQAKSENLLKIKTNQAQTSDSFVGAKQYQEAQAKMAQVQLMGEALLDFEFIVELPRNTEAEIRSDADKVVQYLRAIGDFYFESLGAFPNFLSSLPFGEIHNPSVETSKVLPCYVPAVSYGGEDLAKVKMSPRAMFLHREDYSPFFLDPFKTINGAYVNQNFSLAVIGLSGYGKSFFVNGLTRSLMNDDHVHIIKIDVGSSHSRETRALGGAHYSLSLDKPSGINPLFILSKNHEFSVDSVALISTFIKTLLREQGESVLSKEMSAETEAAVNAYAEMRPENPSINDFLARLGSKIPRKILLERWGSKGNFRNAFAVGDGSADLFDKRLKYFDLANAQNAQDPDFAQGALAAVMSQFNIEMMRIDRLNKKDGTSKKIFFMADETPAFIKNSFEFFAFSVKNVRKFGGSFVPIVQKSSDLVVEGDTSIIDNCASKILFSVDGEPSEYASALKLDLNGHEMTALSSFRKNPKKTQFIHIDGQGSKILNYTATRREYWSYTSSDQDKSRIAKLMAAVPDLSEEEAAACLSLRY